MGEEHAERSGQDGTPVLVLWVCWLLLVVFLLAAGAVGFCR